MSIWDFLLARFDEDELELSRHVNQRGEAAVWSAAEVGGEVHYDPVFAGLSSVLAQTPTNIDARHIARWDPARVQAELRAKRAILTDHHSEPEGTWPGSSLGCVSCVQYFSWGPEVVEGACETLKALAAPYAGHPDFREEWRQ